MLLDCLSGGGIGCSDGSSGGSSDGESGSANNSFLFYSQKWNYADDEFGVALPAKLELKRSIAAGDTLGTPFAEDAVAFCTAGIWGEDDTVVYYVDGDYALWSYAADGTKTQVKEAVANATGAFVSYDSEGKCLFALYDSDNTADKKIFVKDTVSGKSFTVVYGNNVVSSGDITAIAGSKKDSSFFTANGRGSNMNICYFEFSSSFSTMLDAGSEFSDEITGGEIFLLGSEAPFNTEPLKKTGTMNYMGVSEEVEIQYKITDMTVIGGKLYALFASCLEYQGIASGDYDYPYGIYSSNGGVLRINYSGNLSVDTTFGTDGVTGFYSGEDLGFHNSSGTWYYYPYWSIEKINSNLEFNNPQKIIAIKPDELVIAENGVALISGSNAYNPARAVTMDLNGKIKSATAVHGKSFSYGGYKDTDGLTLYSSAGNVQFE